MKDGVRGMDGTSDFQELNGLFDEYFQNYS